jgi:hypothetical protein
MFNGFRMWVFGETDDGGLPGIISGLLDSIGTIPTGIWSALQGIGRLAWDVFVSPMIRAINSVIESINNFFGLITGSGLAEFARTTFNLDIPEIRFAPLPLSPPAELTNVPPPPGGGARLATLPGGKLGGVFSGGALNVGEAGTETIMASQPFAVFTNQFRQAMDIFATTVDTLSTVLMSAPAMSNVDNSMTDNSIHVSTTGSRRSAAQEAAMLASLRQGL